MDKNHHTSVYVFDNVVYSNHKKLIEFYEYSSQNIDEITDFSIASFEDINIFLEKFRESFTPKRKIELYEIISSENFDEIINSYTFKADTMFVEDEKMAYEHIKAHPDLIKTLDSHYKSLPKLPTLTSFKRQLKEIKHLYEAKEEEFTHQKETLEKQQEELMNKINILEDEQKEHQKTINSYSKGFNSHKQKAQKLKIKIKKFKESIVKQEQQAKLLSESFRELQIKEKQLELKKNTSSLFISPVYLVLSFGFLYYSSYNTYSHQALKLEQKKVRLELKKQHITHKITKFSQQIETATAQLEYETSLSDTLRLENYKEILKNTSSQFKSQQKEAKDTQEELTTLIADHHSYISYSPEIVEVELSMLLEKIGEMKKSIAKMYSNTITTQKTKNRYENGLYELNDHNL